MKVLQLFTWFGMGLFSLNVYANCGDIPVAPIALESDQLTHAQADILNEELEVHLASLESFRLCLQNLSDALPPPPLLENEAGEPMIDPAFVEASQALSDAVLEVDTLEKLAIERFNFLVENAVPDQINNNTPAE